MVFKRRDRRSIAQAVLNFLWPRGGWARAFEYVKHRIRRLPDTPERISRGIWAGVFTAFTPFYGLHFFLAAGLAMLMRGNVLAALMGTFIGNPLTYVPIAVVCLQTGYWLLGVDPQHKLEDRLGRKFSNAADDLWDNFVAMFTRADPNWDRLLKFYDEVFFPYMVGGILPGIVVATLCYYFFLPLITAYQNRRRKILREKLSQLKKPTGPMAGDH